MFDSIFEITATEGTLTLTGLLLALGVALLLGFMVSLTYRKANAGKNPSPSFSLTLILLPVVVTVIILLVGNSVARAFSLAGAFSIIRFRSAPGDSKDITYVLFTMAVGLSSGMGYILYAVIITVILCLVMLGLEAIKFGQSKGTDKLLKITVPEDLDYQDAFEEIMQKYTLSAKLQKVKTTELGSLYELVYSVVTKADIKEKDFIDELRCRNGNLSITLVLDAYRDEF